MMQLRNTASKNWSLLEIDRSEIGCSEIGRSKIGRSEISRSEIGRCTKYLYLLDLYRIIML
jgi:hypothetical protein